MITAGPINDITGFGQNYSPETSPLIIFSCFLPGDRSDPRNYNYWVQNDDGTRSYEAASLYLYLIVTTGTTLAGKNAVFANYFRVVTSWNKGKILHMIIEININYLDLFVAKNIYNTNAYSRLEIVGVTKITTWAGISNIFSTAYRFNYYVNLDMSIPQSEFKNATSSSLLNINGKLYGTDLSKVP
jgi:hypothetical protein